MNIFKNQFLNVIEWEEFRDDMIFFKWHNSEIKKGSKLIIRPGQDAIVLHNGKIEGIFTEEGSYDIDSQIIPFLSTLKGFKFGFNSGMRAEVLFVNTKEFTVKWGTKGAINIPSQSLPGGLPIRANGTFSFKVNDYVKLIDKIAGASDHYYVEDVKTRITSMLDQVLMKWIVKEGKDMFNLQVNSLEICKGASSELDMQLFNTGITITNFSVNSFNYPEEVQSMINKSASHSMVGDLNRFSHISMVENMGKGNGNNTASDMASMMMGMNMANQMMNQMNSGTGNSQNQTQTNTSSTKPNFCPNCGQKTGNTNFCANCGHKLV